MSEPGNQEKRRESFGRVAELYDEVRPTYPEQLIEDVVRLTGLTTGGRILEIGSGTGKATLPFARRGFRLLCLEPSAEMAGVARRNLVGFPDIEVRTERLEDWRVEPGGFDLVTAAQAFHWVDSEAGYRIAAEALKPSGSVALFWNFFPVPDNDLRRALDRVYESLAPSLEPMRSWEERVRNRREEIAATGLFGSVQVLRYPWVSVAEADRYLKFLETQSDHIVMEPDRRKQLLDAVRSEIERHGGEVRQEAVAVLFLAKRGPDR